MQIQIKPNLRKIYIKPHWNACFPETHVNEKKKTKKTKNTTFKWRPSMIYLLYISSCSSCNLPQLFGWADLGGEPAAALSLRLLSSPCSPLLSTQSCWTIRNNIVNCALTLYDLRSRVILFLYKYLHCMTIPCHYKLWFYDAKFVWTCLQIHTASHFKIVLDGHIHHYLSHLHSHLEARTEQSFTDFAQD